MKNQTIKNPRQQAQNAAFVTLIMGLVIMIISMVQASEAAVMDNQPLRENYLVVFVFSFVVMIFSFLNIFLNRK
jgi:hypothetical protein